MYVTISGGIVVSHLAQNVVMITAERTIVTLGLLAQPCEEGLAVDDQYGIASAVEIFEAYLSRYKTTCCQRLLPKIR